MALTTPDNIYHPDDPADPADVIGAMEQNADSVQNALLARATVYVQAGAPTAPRVGDVWVQP